MPSSKPSQSSGYGNPECSGAFQLGKSLVDQVEADVRCSIIAPFPGNARSSQLDRRRGDLRFRQATVLGDALNDVPITVPGRKLHRAINVLRILTQYFLDDADVFDEIAPVDRTQETETTDA